MGATLRQVLTLVERDGELRDRFERGSLAEGDVDAHPVLKSWMRSRELRARCASSTESSTTLQGVDLRERLQRSAALLACADDALEPAHAELREQGFALLVSDEDGVVLMTRGTEVLGDAAPRANLLRGARLSEAARGTNAIGTALAEQRAVAVVGDAHYERVARGLCGYAAPIHDALEKTLGVLGISGARDAAHPVLGTLVQTLAAKIESSLRSKQLTLTPILETLPIAVWVADRDGNIVLSNGAARRLWGGGLHIPLEEYERYRAWRPDGRRLASTDWGLARALHTGEVVVDEELDIETFDGQRKVIRNSAARIQDERGRILGAVAVNEDITLLKRAEAARDLFAGILAHDLRNPLNAIAMGSHLLLRSGALAPAQQRVVTRIRSSAARIQKLVDDLLDFTRARFGSAFPIHPAPMDMDEVCGTVVDEMRSAHPDRAIEVERHGPLRGVWDPARVAQVLSNLVSNAVQHGRDPIVVVAEGIGDAVVVSVSNRGEPIPEGTMATLFEPFRKGNDSRGLGLGLFIAREIVQAHGGTIEVKSSERATTFRTRWPRKDGG